MRFALALISLLLLAALHNSTNAQVRSDSAGYQLPPRQQKRVADSLDSVYNVNRAKVDKWLQEHRVASGPREEFASLYFELGGVVRINAKDLNQYFAERAFRPDALSDRTAFRASDFAFTIGSLFRLSRSWGIFVEYDFTGTYFNTIIDSSTISINGYEESLDLTEHALVTGGIVRVYSDRFYELSAVGGVGGVFALTYEEEPKSNATRSAHATGIQLNFDLVNDFRIGSWGGARIDLMTRSTSTGELKTSGGETLSAPFGKANLSTSIAPTASKTTFGFLVGLLIDL